jgi:hypothetical protein
MHIRHPSVVISIALLAASCGRSTPERQDGQGDTKTPPTGALAIEWTDSDLEKDASRVGYGSKPEAILARDAGGALVFTPQTAEDHLATQFAPLQAYDGSRSLELVLDVKSPGGEACVATLQDQAFNVLATVPCRTTGEQRATAAVPSTVNSVRVYFLSAKLEPLHLPARMRLTEQR